LQAAIADRKTAGLVYFVFDLLYLDGWRLDRAALIARTSLLAHVMEAPHDDRLRYSDHHNGRGAEFFAAVQKSPGLEGILSTKAAAQ